MRIKVLSGGRKSIELPLSDAELNFQMRRIGIEETVPMCRLVEVSEKDNPLHRFEGQTVNMDEVNFFARRMESLTEYERKVLSAYVSDYGVATMKDLINLTFSLKGLSLLTDFSDARQVGERLYLDEFLAMSEEEKEQTNFIQFAEKTLKESRVEVLPYVRLRDTLAGIEGKFMVSYNDCEYIRELYQDFQIEAVTRINNLAQRYDNGSEFPEVLIANYDMEERRKSLPMQMNLFEMFDEQKTSVWHGSSRKEDEDDSVSGDNRSAE